VRPVACRDWRERGREMYAFFLGEPQGMNMLAKIMGRMENVTKVYVKYML
jgi:hypothetical protein